MSQPPPYNRQASFANLQALNPTGQPPGNTMDAEFNAIKTTLDAIEANLADIQNDDTTLGNATVGPAQLSSQLTLGFTAPALWVTAKAYTASPASTVLQGTALYICLISHTSGVFATDLASGRWLKILDLSTLTFGAASQITVSAHGSNVATNVQTSLNNLDDNKAATSHTHTASQISDSTTAGRAMLTAANVAAQQTLLGLGSLAFLSSVPAITSVPGQLAFTGRQIALLSATNNDLVPTGWATNAVFNFGTSGGNYSISGFGATTDGDIKLITNQAGADMTLLANSTLSAAANRIAVPRPVVLTSGEAIILKYDGFNSVWRPMSPLRAEPPRGAFRNLRVGNVATFTGDSAPSAPNTQAFVVADEFTLENGFGDKWPLTLGVSVTADATVVGANGIDAGSLGTSQWYSLWVIGNSVTNTVAGLISLSATLPTLPAGYTFFARAGWMRTDGSSHFLKILQYGRAARYTGTMPQMASGAGTYASGVAVANFVPPTAAKIVVTAAGAIGAAANLIVGAGASTSPTAINIANGTGGGTISANSTVELTLEGANIFYGASTAGGGSPSLSCYGWEDNF